ncbi:RagB/SusD family nutrient uptake outer membrane protein [Pedobacter punctiformis]|uniref:RagB/SusD family nutrient uptake outer membrane protein n=1 Tax=Pedobacter punctiformis TaxID=3004097 RepID=A0ABT4LC78_9SPHI|nr:RagB/SusD family nutrient uptake outer membrane protein [Pedobacter sp. HCMS5-2]MCZ4245498.1 RagB/SusD family nutrient uptake outer membrane protein [Pedobacter sp. HCMS5-2]
MKNYKNILAAFLLVLSVSSCKKQLEIDPKQNIDANAALNTTADVQNALIGAYTFLATGDLYGTNLVFIPDIYASDDYLNWRGSFSTYRNISSKAIISNNADVTRTWITAYSAINTANIVLSALNVVSDADTKNVIEGKALFIRGIMHFELVRLYALPYDAAGANTNLGVPIITKAVKGIGDVNNTVARNTVAEVYTAVENDLKSAITKLASVNDQYAAKAFLARVYLQEGKYSLARDMANDIITNSPYQLITNSLEAPFRTKKSSEGIFEIAQNEQSNAGTSNDGLATFYASYQNDTGGDVGRADALVNPTFYNSFEAGDKRQTEMIYNGTGARTGLFTKKWYSFYDNIPVCRITEQYLIRAECNFRLSTAIGATPASDINTLRTRAGLGNVVPTLAIILNEREKELDYEGFRLHDYKRTKRSIGAFAYNDPKLVFPIPDREMTANKALVQNPGY